MAYQVVCYLMLCPTNDKEQVHNHKKSKSVQGKIIENKLTIWLKKLREQLTLVIVISSIGLSSGPFNKKYYSHTYLFRHNSKNTKFSEFIKAKGTKQAK